MKIIVVSLLKRSIAQKYRTEKKSIKNEILRRRNDNQS